MATKEKETNKELEVGEIVSKSEQFIENNSKKIIYGIVALAIIIGAVLGIKHGYMEPQEKKAAAAMFKGELYFDRDSFGASRLLSINMAIRTPAIWRRHTPVSAITIWESPRKRWIY